MRKEQVHIFRLVPILVMIGATMALSIVLMFANELYLDEMICVSFLDVLFLLIFIFELEYERKQLQIAKNASTTFSRIAFGYVVCCVFVAFFDLLPIFCRPFLLITLIMCAVSNEMISFIVSFYLLIIFEITGQDNYYELICYCLIILLGTILTRTLSNKKLFGFSVTILFCINVSVTSLFYYWTNSKLDLYMIIAGASGGLLAVLFSVFLYRLLRRDTEKELQNQLLDILSEDYFQVKELKQIMPAEYAHAKAVSDVAGRCAKSVGLNIDLCSAAGFYYRIGKWQGEPHVENGIHKAASLCFPIELVQIIGEYYGEKEPLNSPESALVQMVDALYIKLKAMEHDVGKNSWNQEMIIYQTMNEFSNMGLYDQSKISMNQFLKIREFLAKEKWS